MFRILLTALCLVALTVSGQVSPYSLSPDWYFGTGARLTFPNGNYPSSTAPVTSYKGTNTSDFVENSTSLSFKDGSVALYTNTMKAYNADPARVTWTDFVYNFVAPDASCAGSSTGGAVAFPDPASPTNAFYIIIANDVTGGGCEFHGVDQYRFTGTGNTVSYNAGPTEIANNSFAGEAITVGTDGTGGYWVVIHNKTTTNTFRVWHYTAGGITGPTDYTIGAAVSDVSTSQSYLKISPCQDKIAYHSGGTLVVDSFNRTTGVVGPELRRISPAIHGVGLEFSPDGSRVFYSGQGTGVSYVDIATGTIGTVAGSGSWSMQMGPDGNIYTSPGGSSIGVISTPNGTPSSSALALANPAVTFRGLINIAWLTPEVPAITTQTNSCTVDFAHTFKNYFQSEITPDATSFNWDFGDGNNATTATASHTFANGGPYTVTLNFKDDVCKHDWTATTQVTVSCSGCTNGINPTAAQSDRNNFCADDAGNITLSATAATAVEWFSDAAGTISMGTGSVTIPSPTSTTTYYVRSAAAGSGCNPSGLVAVTVTVLPLPTPSITGSLTACQNSTGLQYSTAATANTFAWTSTGGVTIQGATNTNSVMIDVGTSSGTLKVTEDNGSCFVENTITITASATAPAGDAGNMQQLCTSTSTGTASLNASPSTGTWSSTNPSIVFADANSAVTSVSGLELGDNTLTWTPTSSCGNGTPDDVVISITANPTPDIIGNTSSCADSLMDFSTNNSGNNFAWTYITTGSGTITTSTTLNAITVNAGDVVGRLILTETSAVNNSCVSKDSVDITLRTQQGIVADAGNNLNPCVATLNLSANSPAGYSGIWTLESGSATIDDALSPSTEISVTGLSATFRWTITGTCGFESFDEVIVTPTSGSNLVANTGNQNDTLCDGSNKDLRVEGTGGSGDYSYHWYNADGSLNEITSSSIINVTPPLGTTEYYVEIIDNVQVGCSSQRDTITIFSTNTQQLVIPNLLTPNGDEKNDLFEVRDVNQLEIFPGSRLEVTNRWGDSVYKNSSYDNSWSPKSLSDGLYYYYLKAGCGDKEYKGWVQVVR